MKEFLTLFECSVRKLPSLFSCVEHSSRSENISLNEDLGIYNRSVNVAFCREMNDSVYVILFKDLIDGVSVANICFDKSIIVAILYILKILKISRICKCINIYNTNIITIFFEHIVNIVRADKTCPSCYKISFHQKYTFPFHFFVAIISQVSAK